MSSIPGRFGVETGAAGPVGDERAVPEPAVPVGREVRRGRPRTTRVLVLADRESGKVANLMLCDTEEDLRKADEALNFTRIL